MFDSLGMFLAPRTYIIFDVAVNLMLMFFQEGMSSLYVEELFTSKPSCVACLVPGGLEVRSVRIAGV